MPECACPLECSTRRRGCKCNGKCTDSRTDQAIAITDEALAHLQGIHELDLSFCDLTRVTAAGLVHLVSLRKLRLSRPAFEDEELVPAAVEAALTELGLDKVVAWD